MTMHVLGAIVEGGNLEAAIRKGREFQARNPNAGWLLRACEPGTLATGTREDVRKIAGDYVPIKSPRLFN